MTLDKHEQQVVTDAAEELRNEAKKYHPSATQLPARLCACADALESLLPKPRFYAMGRSVFDRNLESSFTGIRTIIYAHPTDFPDDATAALIAQDFADVLNKRLGEEA